MIRLHREGDVEGARALHEEQRPSYDLLQIQVNPIPIKAALNLTGHEVGGHRLPMVEPDEGELLQIRSCLERSGLLATASASERKICKALGGAPARRSRNGHCAGRATGPASTRSSRASRPADAARM